MSNREQCAFMLDYFTEDQLAYILACMQGIAAMKESEIPNTETIAAIEEMDELIKSGNYKAYDDVDEMMRDIFS